MCGFSNLVRASLVVIGVAAGAGVSGSLGAREDPWAGLARRIASASPPESTVVLALFDADVSDHLRARLARSIVVIPFGGAPAVDGAPMQPADLGLLYRRACEQTKNARDVWVVGRRTAAGRRRAARFADQAAAMFRRPVTRDSVRTHGDLVAIAHWTDRPQGRADRVRMRLSMAYAESVIAAGPPRRTPVTRPFTRDELFVHPDTLSEYLARLADTSFYSIGGCSEVEFVLWLAAERLSHLGPGVVPALVERFADPDPFVRERVQEALRSAAQDERILARTGGEYPKFYDQPPESAAVVARAWWTKHRRFWTPADTTR